jgi:hypothetical protein
LGVSRARPAKILPYNSAVPGTDEAICLRAMQNTIYSLFRVDSAEPGVALVLTDLATDEPFLLVDIGLSQTRKPGLLLFSRLMLFEDFAANPRRGHSAGSFKNCCLKKPR